MEENKKQLTLSQRIKIEDMLNQRCRKYEIAKELIKVDLQLQEKLTNIKF